MTFEELQRELEELHPAGFGWALHCCDWDREEARDVLQAAYLKVLDGRARFAGRSAVRTWFFGIVRNTAAERRRAGRLRAALSLRLLRGAVPAGVVEPPDRVREDAEMRAELRRYLGRLSRRQRDLLHLVFYEDMTIEDAAHVLGLSVGSARTHYARGKRRLKQWLTGTEEATWTGNTAISRS